MAMSQAQHELTSKLTTMKRQPFGTLEDGTAVEEIKGNLVKGAIDYMLEFVEKQAAADQANQTAIGKAQESALTRLVAMLNAAIPNERFHVSKDYILDESHNYSTEFWLFTIDYGRVISGDPDFYSNSSQGRIPPILIRLFRPLSTAAIFRLMPQIVRRVANADLRLVESGATSATLRWYGHRQEDPLLNELHLTVSSLSYKNILTSIPEVIHGQEPATVEERETMLDGSDFYEWEFRWHPQEKSFNRPLYLGFVGAAILLILYFLLGIPETALLVLAILLPVLIGWSFSRIRRLTFDHEQQRILLQEQRALAEEQYDLSQDARAKLQNLNVDLRRKVDEFTALYEIGLATNATLELDQLIDRTLSAVTTHLHFDRAMLLLVDEQRQILANGRGVGGSQAMHELIEGLEIPLSQKDHYFVSLLNSDGPILIREIDQQNALPINIELAQALGTQEHLGTPLVSKGRRLGILNLDNALSKRPISQQEADLIFVVAGQIAVAIENALLYRQVEYQKQTLEQRVEKRTRELAQATAEAQDARAIAEEASATKSAFLSNVSHELRTPLTAILGFNKIIGRALERTILPNVADDSPRVVRARQTIQESQHFIFEEGERLTSLINDVLDLAKIEAGKLEWDMQQLHIQPVIEHAISATTSLLEKKSLDLKQEIDDNLPSVYGDKNRLIQVIINLLSNAYKFTEQGTITCRATLDREGIIVSVIDQGIGISAEDAAHVFDAFQQADNHISKKPTGTGLGLAICKEIIEFHGGRIWLESEPGQGSMFSFSLPAYVEEIQSFPEINYGSLLDFLLSPPEKKVAEKRRVLVVENEEAVRRYLVNELFEHDFTVIEAESGAQALEISQELTPDILLVDILMPNMDGFQTLAELRQRPSMIMVPAIILSVVDDTHHFYGLGIKAFLPKPVDANQLVAAIEENLNREIESQLAVVVDQPGEQAEALMEALQKRGYQSEQVQALTETKHGQRADILLINKSLYENNNLFTSPAQRQVLEKGLVLLYG